MEASATLIIKSNNFIQQEVNESITE